VWKVSRENRRTTEGKSDSGKQQLSGKTVQCVLNIQYRVFLEGKGCPILGARGGTDMIEEQFGCPEEGPVQFFQGQWEEK